MKKGGLVREVWGQTIGTDGYPVLGGAKVYQITCTPCPVYGYSNSEDAVITAQHDFTDNNGFCKVCSVCEAVMEAGISHSYDAEKDYVCVCGNGSSAVAVAIVGDRITLYEELRTLWKLSRPAPQRMKRC